MRLRKKKASEPGNGPVSVLLMLEALRLAVLLTNAGPGTSDVVRLRSASDRLAEKAMKGLAWPTTENG